ncbi:MAG: biotin transporter BioY [Oscillospiraceae bacterium]
MKTKTQSMIQISLLTALLCVISPWSIYIPASAVPISLGNFAIYISCCLLKPKKSVTSILIFIAIGAIGIPVFSGFSGGFYKLAGPTGGYILGYILIPLIGGFFTSKNNFKKTSWVIGLFLGTFGCYVIGSMWLSYSLGVNLKQAFVVGVLPFIVFDCIKIIVAVFLCYKVKPKINNI